MSAVYTYSFADVSAVISHPDFGQFVANGKGLGSISVRMANDNTAHDVASDGCVMVSKINVNNGTVEISAQQTSNLNQWLVKLYNYLKKANASKWAQIKIVIRSNAMSDLITCTGVSFQKKADRPYQAQGQSITWPMMAADVDQQVA